MREQKLGGHLAACQGPTTTTRHCLKLEKYLEKTFMQFKLIISLTHSLMHEMTI